MALLRRRQRFDPRLIVPVFVESAIYALTMGSLIVFVMTRVLHVSPRLAAAASPSQGLGTRFVMSLGAGVWEETVFRLGIMTGVGAAAGDGCSASAAGWRSRSRCWCRRCCSRRCTTSRPTATRCTLGVFVFRVLAGCFFGLIYWFRGFAIAVYTHALYDVYVLLVR